MRLPTFTTIKGWSNETLLAAWKATDFIEPEDWHAHEEYCQDLYSELLRRGLETDYGREVITQ